VTDGIAMGHQGMKASLVSRDVIADTVELTMRGHCYDALVGLAGCDKSLPGMMMSMVRLNVPSVFIYGGSILPGTFRGQPSPCRTCSRRWAAIRSARCRTKDLEELECVACPSAGACGAQFTANTMACVSEAIGMALPGSAGRRRRTKAATQFERSRRAGDGRWWKATSARATSSPASAGECGHRRGRLRWLDQCRAAPAGHRPRGGIDFDLHDVAEIFKRTPLHRGPEARRPLMSPRTCSRSAAFRC
jgi:dihydroxy-acid dehydratase